MTSLLCASLLLAAPELDVGRTRDRTPGWALASGLSGLFGTAASVGLAVASVTSPSVDRTPSWPLGLTAALILGATVPFVAAGGASARDEWLRGVPALRVVGWVSYALTMTNAIASLILGFFVPVPPAVVATTAVLGFVAGSSMSIEALWSGGRAQR